MIIFSKNFAKMETNEELIKSLHDAVAYCRANKDPKYLGISELLITALSRVDFNAAQTARAIASGSGAMAMVNTTQGRFSTTPKGIAGNPLVAGQIQAVKDVEKKNAVVAEVDVQPSAAETIKASDLVTFEEDSSIASFFTKSSVAEITTKYSKDQLTAIAQSLGIEVQKRMSANIIAAAIKHKLSA